MTQYNKETDPEGTEQVRRVPPLNLTYDELFVVLSETTAVVEATGEPDEYWEDAKSVKEKAKKAKRRAEGHDV